MTRLEAERRRRGWTQTHRAYRAGLSQSDVSRFERRHAVLNAAQALRLQTGAGPRRGSSRRGAVSLQGRAVRSQRPEPKLPGFLRAAADALFSRSVRGNSERYVCTSVAIGHGSGERRPLRASTIELTKFRGLSGCDTRRVAARLRPGHAQSPVIGPCERRRTDQLEEYELSTST
jgi:transcriptional regulator with XRE-family HTH domain